MRTDWRVEERLREKLALLSQELSETLAALDAVRADLAASEKAREEAERELGSNFKDAGMTLAEAITHIQRLLDEKTVHHAAAESRAARLAKALAPFADPARYDTAEEECRVNKAMRWCAVHSFRWPCPVGPARAALAAEEGK